MNPYMRGLLVGTTLAVLAACSPKRVIQDEGTTLSEKAGAVTIEFEARPSYWQAEKAFAARNFDEAYRLYHLVRVKFQRSRAEHFVSYRLGIIHYHRQEYPLAVREFENFLNHFPQSELSFDVTYNLAACEYQQGHYDRAQSQLSRLKVSDVHAQGPQRAQTVFQLLARIASARGSRSGVVSAYALEAQLPMEESSRSQIERKISDELDRMTSRYELEQLLTQVTEPVTQKKIHERLRKLASGSAPQEVPIPQSSIAAAESPSSNFVPAPSVSLASESFGQSYHVGIVLPLSGKWGVYGRKALDAILLASRVFESENSDTFRFFVEDSQSNPQFAQTAVEKLVEEKGVMAIIGALQAKESLAVAERASQMGVLNLSLSPKEGLTDKGAYVFQTSITPRVQMENLARYCVGDRQMKRFAILAPENAFGKDMTDLFWDYVEQFGGKVVAFETYAPQEKDFQVAVQRLVGLHDPRLRKLEWAKLYEYINQQKTEKKVKEPKLSKLSPPPVIDFDGLFVPDSPKSVAQIATVLQYLKVTGFPLLGTAEWASDQLYKRGGRYVEGAIFPSGVSLSSRSEAQRDFVRRYQAAMGTAPDLFAAQAFEAMELLSFAVRSGGTNRRNELVSRMMTLKDVETVLGNVTFDTKRVARRRLPIFSLQAGGSLAELSVN